MMTDCIDVCKDWLTFCDDRGNESTYCQYNTKLTDSTQQTDKPHDTSQGIDGDLFAKLYRDRRLTELSEMFDSYGIKTPVAQFFMLTYLGQGVEND